MSPPVKIDKAVQNYINGIPPEYRSLFDRMHRLVSASHPEATLVLSYRMPTYKIGKRKLHVGVWKHGLSLYGWPQGSEAALVARHPTLQTSKGTLKLRPDIAAEITDDEIDELVRAALDL